MPLKFFLFLFGIGSLLNGLGGLYGDIRHFEFSPTPLFSVSDAQDISWATVTAQIDTNDLRIVPEKGEKMTLFNNQAVFAFSGSQFRGLFAVVESGRVLGDKVKLYSPFTVKGRLSHADYDTARRLSVPEGSLILDETKSEPNIILDLIMTAVGVFIMFYFVRPFWFLISKDPKRALQVLDSQIAIIEDGAKVLEIPGREKRALKEVSDEDIVRYYEEKYHGECPVCKTKAFVDVRESSRCVSFFILWIVTSKKIIACDVCARKMHLEGILGTVLLGWWSLYGIFMTPFFIINGFVELFKRAPKSGLSHKMRCQIAFRIIQLRKLSDAIIHGMELREKIQADEAVALEKHSNRVVKNSVTPNTTIAKKLLIDTSVSFSAPTAQDVQSSAFLVETRRPLVRKIFITLILVFIVVIVLMFISMLLSPFR